MDEKRYLQIIAHYESCLERHGDTHLGVDWPNEKEAAIRYQVMLEIMGKDNMGRVSLLDFGCGASHLYEYILQRKLHHVEYSGLDMSEKFVRLSQGKFPQIRYYCLDVLEDPGSLPDFDYIVMNGVFTEKCTLSFNEMFFYFKRLLCSLFVKAKRGVAFNVMSSHVDWEREDLFHLPLDTLAAFLTKELSRDFVIRNDYRLYEYTAYLYKRA
jgi:hypothetical protein